jgi:ACS family D-galactonate transporter-like MFS transporter
MTETNIKPRAVHWIALFLLVTSVCINYADRGNLGVAGTRLQSELHLSATRLGELLAAFAFTYALSQIGMAKVIDRWNVNWLYALAFFLWSAATGATGLANFFWQIFLLRLLLGISESVAYPAYAKMMVVSFPERLRGTANGLIDAGSKLGPAIGLWVGGHLLQKYDWRGMFIVIGAASLAWLVPWCLLAGRLPHRVLSAGSSQVVRAVSYGKLMESRVFWGTAVGLFGGNYAWYFMLYWLPAYLEKDRHYSHAHLTNVGTLCYVTVALSSASCGFIADWFIKRGHEAGKVRRFSMCLGLLLCCPLMFAAVLAPNEQSSTTLLLLMFVTMGGWSSNHWALSQMLAGPATAGKWTGLQNCIGNFAGIFAPWISGYALDRTKSFFVAFAIASGFLLMAVISYWFVVGKPKQVFHLEEGREGPDSGFLATTEMRKAGL